MSATRFGEQAGIPYSSCGRSLWSLRLGFLRMQPGSHRNQVQTRMCHSKRPFTWRWLQNKVSTKHSGDFYVVGEEWYHNWRYEWNQFHGTVRPDSRKFKNGLVFRTSGGCSLFTSNVPMFWQEITKKSRALWLTMLVVWQTQKLILCLPSLDDLLNCVNTVLTRNEFSLRRALCFP